jgi:tetratricopeptide (TPR) repeat protein
LDGIPLAIELAAARLNVLTTGQLVHNLDNAFRLLNSGVRTTLPRQQTLRAAIDWSYRLLTPQEQTLLRRLSIFNGSFDLQAVETVCCLEATEKIELLDFLTSLVNKSMLLAEHLPGIEMRYRLLETVRQFAQEKLNDAGESVSLHDKHAAYYLELAKQGGRKSLSQQAPMWLKRLDADYQNIRAAFSWSLEGEKADMAVEPLLALRNYWMLRSMVEEGLDLLGKALNRLPPDQVSSQRAGLLREVGLFAFILEEKEQGLNYARMSREMFQKLGDRSGYAWTVLLIGMIEGDKTGSLAESTAIFRDLGNEEDLAFALWIWGFKARDGGEFNQAEQLLKESATLYQKMGSWKLGDVYFNLATVYYMKGQPQLAQSTFTQAVPFLQEVGDQWGLMYCRWSMGKMELAEAVDEADLRDARTLLLESLETAQKIGNRFWLNYQIPMLLADIAQKLGEHSQVISWLQSALDRLQELGMNFVQDHLFEVGQCLIGVARASLSLGDPTRGANLLGVVDRLLENHQDAWRGNAPEIFSQITEQTRSILTEANFQVAWEEGRRMTLDEALRLLKTV